MANVIGKKNIRKFVISVGILFLLTSIFVVFKVMATSSIKVNWSYKNIDDNYIVCQVVDEDYGIDKVTNCTGDIESYVDGLVRGQTEPITIKYLLGDGETDFKVWNTKGQWKIITLNSISLNISNASTNTGGNILAIAAETEDGTIDKIEYGNVTKTYNNTNLVYESLTSSMGNILEAKITISDSNYPITVKLNRDDVAPEEVHVYRNDKGEIALTTNCQSGVFEINDLDGNKILSVDRFERRGTYVFSTSSSQVLVKSAVGNERIINVPSNIIQDGVIEASVTYEETNFVINASNKIGLWKITNKDNDSIIYKYDNEPKEFSYSMKRIANISGVKIYNMAGNCKEVIFDKKGPDILWAYKNISQNTIIACIEDTDSGLKCVRDDFNNDKFTFNHKENRATFEYFVENNVDELKIYDYENNVSILKFSDIKFNVDSAYKNIDGNKISIVASIDNGKIDRITYLDDTLIDKVQKNSVDAIYDLENDGTVKVKLYDENGNSIIVLLDYEENDVPIVTKFSKSERKQRIYLRASDRESGIDKITYKDGRIIKKFDEYVSSIDDTYWVNSNTKEVLIWDRIGNNVQVDFLENYIDEEGPELIDTVQYASNGDDYTIAIRDMISGLDRITKADNQILYSFYEDGYPEISTYNGKLSVDGNTIKIYDRLGNHTTINVDGKGPTVKSCVPFGDITTDWRLVVIDEETGISRLTYEDGTLIESLERSTNEETIDFKVVKGTKVVRIYDTQDNFSEITLDEDKPEILSLTKQLKHNIWEITAKDLGSGLKSVRTTPDGSDIATFTGNTRRKETILLEIPETANEIYLLDQVGNISDAYEIDREQAIPISGEVEIKPVDGANEIHSGIVVDKNDGNETVLKLYNKVSINIDSATGKISQTPGISIPEGATVKLLIGDNDVHIYGGYVGSGYRNTDANYIHYPGISVPEGATLIIEEKPGGGRGTLYVYGNGTTDYGIGDGSGAGIGGYGVVKANSGATIYGQSSGRIEIRSGKVVSVSNATANAYGTGAGIGGGGACAWRGRAEAGVGNLNNIIIYDEAHVEAKTNGTRGVGANIGGGGRFDKRNRRGSSGETSIVRESDLPKVKVSHIVKDDGSAEICVKAQSEVGLYMICLDEQKVVFEKFPVIEKTCSFVVDENREYTIKVIDKDDLTEIVKYKIDDIGKTTTPWQDEEDNEPLNDSIIYVSQSTDKGIKINRDCTIIFENEDDIIINKEYRTNNDGMAGIHIKDGVNVKILKKGRGNVAIYGGHKGNSISYPGIMVPKNSTLEIYGTLDAKIYAFGYGMVTEENIMIGGSGAGIGGYGYYNQIGDAKAQDCGSVKILSGNVEAFGGTIEVKTGTSCGTGAGIGGGGAYSVVGMATSGSVKGKIENYGAKVVAVGGVSKRARGAKFGDGGAYTAEGVNIQGQEINIECDYIEISKDTKVTSTTKKGYRITKSCKLTFENEKDIIIGSPNISCAGISIEKGVEARISIEGRGNISIYGGCQTKNPDYCVMYPSIEVPKGAGITIDNNTAKSLSLYAGGVDKVPVTASVIGTCGVYSTSKFVSNEDVGTIIINGGAVNINPKKNSCKAVAVGAGIGSGGIGSSDENAIIKQGVLEINNYHVADVANVVINTKDSTKVGNGSIIKGEKVINGEEKIYKVIDTLAPEVSIGRVDSNKLGYAQIKVSAKDTLSGLSKVVLDDGTVYRFPIWGQEIGSVYLKRYRNGKVRAKVYDTAGNYKEVSYVVKGLDKRDINKLINIDVKNNIIHKVGDGEYVNISFKKQDVDVRMYVRINEQKERMVHKGNDEFNYTLQVLDNCMITARMENVKTLETIWEESEIICNRVKVSTSGIVNKESTKAVVEGMIRGLYKEDYNSNKIRRIGVYYSIVGENKKVWNVWQDNLDNAVRLDEISMKYNLTMTKLKPDTKYKAQVYIINDLGEEIKGEERYFVTKANGKGLTTRHYEVDSSIPTLIKQSYNKNLNTDISVLEPIRNKYGEIMINRVSKGNMEWIGSIAPIDSRKIWFKIKSNKDLTIKIGQETLDVLKGESIVVTKNVYMQGNRYPFKMLTNGDTAGEIKIEVSWLEDGQFQEITASQFYSKEYVKIESLVVDSKGKLIEEIDKNTGKVINKKVLTKGRTIKKLDIMNDKVVLENGSILKLGKNAKIEGNIILKEDGVILPIIDNVSLINYKNLDVLLTDGTELKLYKDIDIVGSVEDLRNNKVYDLCKYIQKINGKRILMSDGRKLLLGDDVRVIDGNYVLSLYPNTYESKEYQELMNEYATVERLVYEMSTSNIKDVSIGEARLYEVIPIKILLSFDGDDVFTMKDPVIEINGALTNDKNGKINSNLKLELPGDSVKTGYASWTYMNNSNGNYLIAGDSSNYATVEKLKNGNFRITLDGYSKKYGNILGYNDNNVMLNLLLQIETSENITKEEVINNITAYTKVKIKEITIEDKRTKLDAVDATLSIKIKK